MTLTSSPCELDNMSLFQDLKLKRRKVDSRCSSDGESAADTSTSSPDNMPGSPGCPMVKVKTESLRSSPSPGTPRDIRELRDLRGSDVREATSERASPDSVFPEAASSRSADERFCTPASSASPVSPVQSHTNVFTSPTPREVHRGETPDRGTSNHYLVQPKEESDNSVFDGGGRGEGMTSHPSHCSPSPSPNRNQSPSPGMGNVGNGGGGGGGGGGSGCGSGLNSGPNQQPGPRQRAPTVPPHLLAHHQFWTQNPGVQSFTTQRLLNGVISSAVNFGQNLTSATGASNEGMKPPAQRVAPATPRPAPTVMMGEVGGVRTMIWSLPPSEPAPTPTASWTATTASSSTSEESAAQVLLNLRSEPRGKPPGTSQSFGPPLNMERLWAGDLSQLPAAQQIQALNLTASSSQPWSRNGNMLTTEAPSQQPSAPPLQPQEHEEEEQPMICMICEDKATGLHYGIITCEGCKGFFKRTVQNRRVYTCVAEGICEITKAQRNRCQYCRFKKCIEQGMVLQAVREDRMPGGRNSGAVYNLYKVKYKKHKKTNKGMNVGAGLGGTGGVNGSGSLSTAKGTMAPTMLEKHMAAAAAVHHNQQHAQLAGALLQHHKGPSGPESMNSSQQPAPGHQNLQGHQGHAGHLVNGTILKTALTNPSEVVHLRQRLDNAVSSSRDRAFPLDATLAMIQTLIDCDEFQDIATLRNLDELLDHKSDLSEKLCQIGDSIVYKLVQWTKRLPFYLELPVEVHTRLLTHKWHELLVLTTSAYQAIHGQQKWTGVGNDGTGADFTQEVSNNLCTLQTCLTSMMGRPITMDQLRQDVGLMVEKITYVTLMFRQVKLRMEEYVCLKVITMLSQARDGTLELEQIQERYMSCLRSFVENSAPQQPGRFHDLLVRLPEVQSAAALLLESKMFYVPFLLNSAIQR